MRRSILIVPTLIACWLSFAARSPASGTSRGDRPNQTRLATTIVPDATPTQPVHSHHPDCPPDCPGDCPPLGAWPLHENFTWLFEPADGPHIGLGQPLVNASWLNRPLSVGLFLGTLTGNELTEGLVEDEAAIFTGLRAGWDFDAYWGLEARLGFADPKLHDVPSGRDYDEGDVVLWDVNILCYPWGESRWRPYAGIGLGMAKFSFVTLADQPVRDDTVAVPLGVGLKYRCTPWLAARFDLTDTLSLDGDATGTLNNFSFTFGAEYRFGGERTFYWPWQSGGL